MPWKCDKCGLIRSLFYPHIIKHDMIYCVGCVEKEKVVG